LIFLLFGGDFMKVSKGTIIRTVVLVVALANQVLTAIGKNPLPFSSDQAGNAISIGFTAGASILAWWKNNSFTQAAIAADEVMKKSKESGC